ncbi:MAG: DUF86 domain-containing protein [Candidatus Aminicenantia bacterium]
MLSINLDRIAKNKADILEVKREVENIIGLPKKDFLKERRNSLALKYLLIQAVEAVVDISQHILAKIKGIPCEGYVDCIIKAGENGLITKKLAEKLRRLMDLRNNLIHRYWRIDDNELYTVSKENISDLESFVSQIDDFIKKVGTQ